MHLDRSWFHSPSRYALALGTEIAAPALRFYAGRRATAAPSPPAAWRTVGIFGSSHIGDVLYRTASLPFLRRALPDARIIYVCAPAVAELLAGNPNVDEILPLVGSDREWRRSPTTRTALRAHALDAALCTDHIAYEGDLSLVVQLGVPNRVAFAHKGLSAWATRPIVPRGPQPAPAFFQDMVAQLGTRSPDWDLTPIIYLTDADRAEAAAAWDALAITPDRHVVACTLTSRQPDPVWPADRYRRALELCAEQHDLEVVFCGSAGDAPILRAVADACAVRSHVLAGRLGLRAFAAFLARCDALLATDSGPRHLANAVATPVVFVRRLATAAAEVGVYCANEIDAAPAGEHLSRRGQLERLAQLEPAAVAAILGRQLPRRQLAKQH